MTFEIIATLAKYFGGGLPISELLKMTNRKILFWFKQYELQMVEQEIAQEYLSKDKKVPKPEILRKLTNKRITEKGLLWQKG